MTLYAWRVVADAVDETDAAIVAEVLAGAVRDERNDPAELVDVTFAPLEGPDVVGRGSVQNSPAPPATTEGS